MQLHYKNMAMPLYQPNLSSLTCNVLTVKLNLVFKTDTNLYDYSVQIQGVLSTLLQYANPNKNIIRVSQSKENMNTVF